MARVKTYKPATITGPGTDGLYRYKGVTIEVSGWPGRYRAEALKSGKRIFEVVSLTQDGVLALAKQQIDDAEFSARPRVVPMREKLSERKFSMTYGVLPPFEQFERDIHTRIDPETDEPYWPEGTTYPMELVSSREIELAEEFGGLDNFRTERQRTGRHSGAHGFRGDERQIYDFLKFLMDQDDAYNGEEDSPGSLASSIMYTLGYEWI